MLIEFRYMKNTFLIFFPLMTHDFVGYMRQTNSKLFGGSILMRYKMTSVMLR